MASCITSQWANSYSPQVRLTVTQSSSTATTATLHWVAEWVGHGYAADISSRTWSGKVGSTTIGGTFAASGITGTKTMGSGDVTITKTTAAQTISFSISFPFNMSWSSVSTTTRSASGSISVAAKTSYKITYNANGGSGAPSAQTKWHGTAITLSSTKPTRTGYTFQGWGTSASDTSVDYAAGASYTANTNATLYAIWKAVTYTVKFDANGGTSAPGNQTKTYGVTLKLSSTKPTRTNYNFLGWGTSKSATTVSYAAGADYTANAGITLYAIWELAYVKPRITNLSVTRCDENGVANDEGKYAIVAFNWACDQTVSSIKINWSPEANANDVTVSASGTSGSVNEKVGGSFSTETTYTIEIVVADASDETYGFGTLHGMKFMLDFLTEGKGAAMNKPAELEGVFDIGFQTRFYGGIKYMLIPAETDLNTIQTPGFYIGENVTNYDYTNCPIATGTFTLEVQSGGDQGQVRQLLTPCLKDKTKTYERFYYSSAWGAWHGNPNHIIALYNVGVTFTSGVATYTNENITSTSFVMVQTRSSTNTNNRGYCTSPANGSVKIGTDAGLNATIYLNILIINM